MAPGNRTGSHPPPEPVGIESWLERAQGGDAAAERRLLDRVSERVRALAQRRLGDEEAANEIARDTMDAVSQTYRAAAMPRGFLPWVFANLRNKAGLYLKRRLAGGLQAIDVDEWWLAQLAGISPDGRRRSFDMVHWLQDGLLAASAECRSLFAALLSGKGREMTRAVLADDFGEDVEARLSSCLRELLDRAQTSAHVQPEGARPEGDARVDREPSRCAQPDGDRLLGSYLFGLLDRGERARFEEHLLGCDACFAELERSAPLVATLQVHARPLGRRLRDAP